jgi:hypothetical protein
VPKSISRQLTLVPRRTCRMDVLVGLIVYLSCLQGVGSHRSNSGRYDVNKAGADVEL